MVPAGARCSGSSSNDVHRLTGKEAGRGRKRILPDSIRAATWPSNVGCSPCRARASSLPRRNKLGSAIAPGETARHGEACARILNNFQALPPRANQPPTLAATPSSDRAIVSMPRCVPCSYGCSFGHLQSANRLQQPRRMPIFGMFEGLPAFLCSHCTSSSSASFRPVLKHTLDGEQNRCC